MFGNATQWVEDVYRVRYDDAESDRLHIRVYRGFIALDSADRLSCTNRGFTESSSRIKVLGFRLAKSL